mmetsp:Transcript_33358/g.51147  ORF Transcript_33358/g.51147 Transcript_33358/m.51147 type:complete len:201 (+) Transcript_33358:1209-1811(+)
MGDVKFQLGDHMEIKLKPQAYLLDIGNACSMIFTGYRRNVTMPHKQDPSKPIQVVLGAQFLRYFYTILDYDSMQMGLGIKPEYIGKVEIKSKHNEDAKKMIALIFSLGVILCLFLIVIVFFLRKGKACCFKRSSSLIFAGNNFLGTKEQVRRISHLFDEDPETSPGIKLDDNIDPATLLLSDSKGVQTSIIAEPEEEESP